MPESVMPLGVQYDRKAGDMRSARRGASIVVHVALRFDTPAFLHRLDVDYRRQRLIGGLRAGGKTSAKAASVQLAASAMRTTN